MQHSSKREGAVRAAAHSTVIADFQDCWSYTGPDAMQGGFVTWMLFEGRKQKILEDVSQIFCYNDVRNHSLQRCSVKLFFFFLTFFLAGMHITLAWRRWCRCSVKWFWSSHCSSWMQTWTPRTISQHYFLWVLLHLTLLGVFLLVCRSLNSWSSSWLRTLFA